MTKSLLPFIAATSLLFCLLLSSAHAEGAARESSDISSMVSLLLNNSINWFPKSISGQPGEVKSYNISGIIDKDDKFILDIDNDLYNNFYFSNDYEVLYFVIPYIDQGKYKMNILIDNKIIASSQLNVEKMVLKVELDAYNITESIFSDINANFDVYFQDILDGSDLGYNRQVLQNIIENLLNEFSQLDSDIKSFIASYLMNSDILNILNSGYLDSSKDDINVNQKIRNEAKSSLDISNCFTSDRNLDPYLCGDTDFSDWKNTKIAASRYNIDQLISWLVDKMIDETIKFIVMNGTKSIEKKCIDKYAHLSKRIYSALKSYNYITLFFNAMKSINGSHPIIMDRLEISDYSNELSYMDETSFKVTAYFYPAEDLMLSFLGVSMGKVQEEVLKKLKLDDCVPYIEESINIALSEVEGFISNEIIRMRNSNSESKPIAIPTTNTMGTQLYISPDPHIGTEKYSCLPYAMGSTLYVKHSPAKLSQKSELDAHINFALKDRRGDVAGDSIVIKVKNRIPEIAPITSNTINPELYLNVKIATDLPIQDQECDPITDYEIIGTAQFGNLELDKNDGIVYYTLTNPNPPTNEILQYRVKDGAQWSEYMPLTIDLGSGYDCIDGPCGCDCIGEAGDGMYRCLSWTSSGDLRQTYYSSNGSSTYGKCLTVNTYLIEGNADATDCVRDSYNRCTHKSATIVTRCPHPGGTNLVDFDVRGLTSGYMWGQCEYTPGDCGNDTPYAIVGHSIPLEGGDISGVIQCGFASKQACDAYVWSQISPSDESEIKSNQHRSCTGVIF